MATAITNTYFRTVKRKLRRFPNWPINMSLNLGEIGFYHSRTACFSWRTSLLDLGVNVDPQPGTKPMAIDELYTYHCRADFSLDANEPSTANASFRFARATGIATQTFQAEYQRLPLDTLEKELNRKLEFNPDQWNSKWVIVTQLWNAPSFTALISQRRGAAIRLSANVTPDMNGIFNLADPNLHVRSSSQDSSVYCAFSRGETVPFFDIHILTYRRGKYQLKPYGRNRPFF